MNFGYVSKTKQADNLDYLNCLATFKDKDTVVCSKNPQIIHDFLKTGELPELNKEKPQYYEIKAKNFLIATGTRPFYLPIEGAELAITSDDIFHLKKGPGKTLIVGGGYVGVEIAGFLAGMGYDVTMMTRDVYLRPFDRDMVDYLLEDLKQRNIKMVDCSLPDKIIKKEDGKLEVTVKHQKDKHKIFTEEFDTVLMAVGRQPTTDNLNLKAIGV